MKRLANMLCTVVTALALAPFFAVSSVNAATPAVGAGTGISATLKTDGTVWTWGKNNYGQLGNDSRVTQSVSPVPATITGATAIAVGDSHMLAVKSDGSVWAWGKNDNGQLGNGLTALSRIPIQVAGLANVTAVAAGVYTSAALKSDGTVWTWGKNNLGQLGSGTFVDSKIPVQVSGLTNVTAIAVGMDHMLALKADGSVWAWGLNNFGQLGNGTYSLSTVPVQVLSNLNGVIAALTGVTAISCGSNFSLAVMADKSINAWGDVSSGQLGNAEDATTRNFGHSYPVAAYALSSTEKTTVVADNDVPAAAVTGTTQDPLPVGVTTTTTTSPTITQTDPTLTQPGATSTTVIDKNTVTDKTTKTTTTPAGTSTNETKLTVTVDTVTTTTTTKITSNTSTKITTETVAKVTTTTDTETRTPTVPPSAATPPVRNTSMVRDTRTVTTTDTTVTTATHFLNAAAASGGLKHAVARLADGSVTAWGANGGLLGNATEVNTGSLPNSNVGVSVTGFPSTAVIIGISAGSDHTIALGQNNTVWSWGNNESGQLGNGSTINYPFPIQITAFDGSAFLVSAVPTTTPTTATNTGTPSTSTCESSSDSDADRIFNWAEATYGSSAKNAADQLFYPPAVTLSSNGYVYRYYSGTNAYLAYKAETSKIYDRLTNTYQDFQAGAIYYYAPTHLDQIVSLGRSCVFLNQAKAAKF